MDEAAYLDEEVVLSSVHLGVAAGANTGQVRD